MKMLRLCLLVMLCCAVTACGGVSAPAGKLVKQYGGEKTRPDNVPARFIILTHPPSGERIEVIYYNNGKYDPKAMKKINHLMRDRRANVIGTIDPELIDFLVDIRTRLGLPPNVVFEITSGYRSPETNAQLARKSGKVAKESLHTHGWAVDFRIQGVNGSAVTEIAKTMQRGGASFYPNSNHVHVDIGNIRTWKTN